MSQQQQQQQGAPPAPADPVFVGIDVAKAKLDVFVVDGGGGPDGEPFTVENTPDGIRAGSSNACRRPPRRSGASSGRSRSRPPAGTTAGWPPT